MPCENPCPGWYSGDNKRLFELLSVFLNLRPDYITPDMIESIAGKNARKEETEYAYAALVASACGLDIYGNREDRRFFAESFRKCFTLLDTGPFTGNPYYTNISFENISNNRWQLQKRVCRPFEAFVFDDPEISGDVGGFSVTPKIGFFNEAYNYPAVLENGREWMTLMPNETNTSGYAVDNAHGRVLTFGLGLGYFAYMAARKPEVSSVTVVELSRDVISLFEEHILPQTGFQDKIRVIRADCFDFADGMKPGEYDFLFADIWHDPSDGVEAYLRLKEYEPRFPGTEFVYWIENTLKLYI